MITIDETRARELYKRAGKPWPLDPPRKARKRTKALKPDPYPYLTAAVVAAGFEPPEREHQFALDLGREFAFDYAWPERMLAVEVDGLYHTLRTRWRLDIVKFNLATLYGWRVFHFKPKDVRDEDGGPGARVLIELLHCGADVARQTVATLWPPGKE